MPSHRARDQAPWAGPALLITSTLITLLVIEIVLRLLIGQPISFRKLGDPDVKVQDSSRDLTPFASAVQLVPGTDPAWINLDPAPLPERHATDPEMLTWRENARATEWPNFENNLYRQWNAAYLRSIPCDSGLPILSTPGPLYEFDTADGSVAPLYRYLPNRTDPLGMRTNRFAFRGPDIPLDKPPGTVRLAFVGASTTVGSKHCRASYPEYVIHWLNLWAQDAHPELHFDGINAGREGISSMHIEAIVRNEVLPMEPDLILYYEGVNHLRNWIRYNESLGGIPEPEEDETLSAASRYSVLVLRLRKFILAYRRTGIEPIKPEHTVSWPRGVSQSKPDPFDKRLPYALPRIIEDLDDIQRLVTSQGSELALASFVFLVEDGMALDPWRDGLIEKFYRTALWPLTYAEIRDLADFENRVFQSYARARIMGFVDLAATYPQDPTLFLDGVHFNCPGIRLQAWIVFQKLLPLIQGRLASGRWPRSDEHPLQSHPGIPAPRLAENFCRDTRR